MSAEMPSRHDIFLCKDVPYNKCKDPRLCMIMDFVAPKAYVLRMSGEADYFDERIHKLFNVGDQGVPHILFEKNDMHPFYLDESVITINQSSLIKYISTFVPPASSEIDRWAGLS